jgi:hypothetical protein
MKTRDTQGSFILVIWTLIAKVKDVTNAAIVPIHPHADMVAGLFLRPVICRSLLRRQAEEHRLNQRVFRYCSSQPPTPSYTSSFLSRVQG